MSGIDIGVVGAGAIGSYYAGLLSRAGHSVRLLARGDHRSAIEARGLEVRTPEETFVARLDAIDDRAPRAGCEYVILAVKGYSLADVAPTIAHAAKSGAAVVPLLNGIDVAERLEALGVPRSAIIGGLATVSVFRTASGVVERRTAFDRVVLGELDGVSRARTTRLVAALASAGVEARVSDDIVHDLWRKFAFIVPMTVACGLSRRSAGAVLATERGRGLITGSLRELLDVSRAAGGRLTGDDEATLTRDLIALPAAMRPSFLQDLERGGPTEVDLLAGTVSRLGHAHGIPTPIHDVATAAFESAIQPG